MSVPQIPGIKAEGELAQSFRHEVAQLMGRTNTNFPGAQPVSFARHHINELCNQDYFLCEKTDGIRCLLYITNGDAGEEIVYLIDRKNDYYFIPNGGLHFPKHNDPTFNSFHSGTLLDGELVNDTMPDGSKKLRYLVFDCVVLDNEPLMNRPLDKRIGRYFEFVDKPLKQFYARHPKDAEQFVFEVRFKAMDKPYALEEMFNHKLPNLPHGNDGLVFTCKSTTYVSGTDEHILKWKPAHENSIDFKLALGQFPVVTYDDGTTAEDWDAKPTFDLLVYHGSNDYETFASLYITDADWEAMKALNEQLDGRIIECYRDSQGRWRFKAEENGAPRFRDDKPTANHISTVRKVLESIEDGVTQEELIAAAPGIMRAWKKRHPEENQNPHPHGTPVQERPQPPTWRRSESMSGVPPQGLNGRMNGH
ncbi:uncharacterized protein PV09_06252 [Verruconis gallopava]|uniref:mRNA-capping enzyme subunit alpha n=1 Tax=Verruconis gallopava TaxID=253628 RepID=A0A0D2A6T0_9PEZI|nr:uncharacterized protein PV09_06252 [Verruconis gallopava]KIW02438.1 hypothetical protein PV09_06252 [Verruconis gallopava]